MSEAGSRALDDLYRSHAQEVYRYAYAILGNRPDAEDVVQTTFVNALRALERGERPRKPSNWLITIAHNIVRQRFRQQRVRPTEVTLDREPATREPADDRGPTMGELVRALQRIPQSQREALVLRELEGRSYDEIAQILGRSTSALETLLFRARRSLADELENAVTCDRADLDLSRQLDGRLSRKARRRLNDHIAECGSCRALQEAHGRRRRAFDGLAALPLPSSLVVLDDAPVASAALGPSTVGSTGAPAAASGGTALGGLALGAACLTTATVAAALLAAGSVGAQDGRRHRSAAMAPPTVLSVGAAPERPSLAAHLLVPPIVESPSLDPQRPAPGEAEHSRLPGSAEQAPRPLSPAAAMPATTAAADEHPPEASRAKDGAIALDPPPASAPPPAPTGPTSSPASGHAPAAGAETASATPSSATAPAPGGSVAVPPASTPAESAGETGDPSSAAAPVEPTDAGAEPRTSGDEASSTEAQCDAPGATHALVVARARVEPTAPGLAEVARWWVCRPSIEGSPAVTAQDASGADVISHDPPAAVDDGVSLPRAQPTRSGPERRADEITGAGGGP